MLFQPRPIEQALAGIMRLFKKGVLREIRRFQGAFRHAGRGTGHPDVLDHADPQQPELVAPVISRHDGQIQLVLAQLVYQLQARRHTGLQRQPGALLGQGADQHPQPAKRGQFGDADTDSAFEAHRAANPFRHAQTQAQRLFGQGQQPLAVGGQCDAGRTTMEQAPAQFGFQVIHAFGDRGLRRVQRRGGGAQAA
ncbi:hypothetical protein D3C72_1617070 [compost metagenome]